MNTALNVDEYIASFPASTAERLKVLRKIVREEIPLATEAIKYGMPMFVYQTNLIGIAGYKSHIGMYPITDGMRKAFPELAPYISGQATLKFPLNKDMPLESIRKAVAFRLKEHLEKRK